MRIRGWHLAFLVSVGVHGAGFFLVRVKTFESFQSPRFIQVGLYESSWTDRWVNLPGEAERDSEIFEATDHGKMKDGRESEIMDFMRRAPLLPRSSAMSDSVEDESFSEAGREDISRSLQGKDRVSKEESETVGQKEKSRIEGPAADRFLLYHQEPDYPAWARQYGLEFEIRLKFWIQSSGEVSFVEVENSSGYPEVDAEVIQVIKRWRFNAVEGSDVQWGKIRFKFRLN